MQFLGRTVATAAVLGGGWAVATGNDVIKVLQNFLAQNGQGGGPVDPRVDQLAQDMRALLMSQGGRNTVVLSQGGSSSGRVST
jgi:hypothetical protein